MRKIAYATYFKKFGSPWNRELVVGTDFLRNSEMQADDFGLLIENARSVLETPVFEGTNQEVFKYSFQQTESDDPNDKILVMKFYEGFEVWVFAQSETTGPKL